MAGRRKSFVGIPPIETAVGQPLWESARDAHANGSSLWTCVVVLAAYHGSPIMVSSGATSITRASPDELLNGIKQLGWRLEHVNHVYVQTTTSSGGGFAGTATAGVSGQLEGHFVFSRV